MRRQGKGKDKLFKGGRLPPLVRTVMTIVNMIGRERTYLMESHHALNLLITVDTKRADNLQVHSYERSNVLIIQITTTNELIQVRWKVEKETQIEQHGNPVAVIIINLADTHVFPLNGK